jgi:hypothetical protein
MKNLLILISLAYAQDKPNCSNTLAAIEGIEPYEVDINGKDI